MRRSRMTNLWYGIVGLSAALLLAIMAVPLGAQPAHETRPVQGLGPAYDAAHEITLSGTIESVVTKHTLGRPAGMHLLIKGENGIVDAHVGPFLAKNVQQALSAGLPLQVVGSLTQLRGRQYLLVRELTFGGRTVMVRNRNGMLAYSLVPRTRAERRTSETTGNGGAR